MIAAKLPRQIVNQMLRLASQSPDAEICGLISGCGSEFKRCYPIANIATDKRRFFDMDPKGQIAAMRAMRAAGEELKAIYHSHPTTPPLPSPIDIERHAYPDVLYLIISLNTKGVLEMRGYQLREGLVREVSIGM